MIEISGESDSSAEYRGAVQFKRSIEASLSRKEIESCQMILKPSLKIANDPDVKDIDIVLAARFRPPIVRHGSFLKSGTSFDVVGNIWTLLAAIEVKSHSGRAAKLDGKSLWVLTKGTWKNASEQSFKQAHALREYMNRLIGGHAFARNYIYLASCNRDDLSTDVVPDEILFRDTSFDTFIERIVSSTISEQLKRLARERAKKLNLKDFDDDDHITASDLSKPFAVNSFGVGFSESNFKVVRSHLSEIVTATPLDRKRLEQISSSRVNYPALNALGANEVIVRGYGGAGKTVVLLRTAVQKYKDDKRVLLLTYNVVLVSDLNRQLILAKIGQGALDCSIIPNTLHQFFKQWLIQLGIEDEENITDKWFDSDYYTSLQLAVNGILSGEIRKEKLENVKAQFPNRFDFDFVFVDEGQDWHDVERDFLYAVYGSENLLIALGRDQLIRKASPCKWDATAVKSDIIRLRRCLRLTPNLATFVNTIAESLNLSDWNLESDDKMSGGRVYVRLGLLSNHLDLLKRVVAENAQAGNETIDMLFCVPYQQVEKSPNGDSHSKLGEWLESNNYELYDAVNQKTRQRFPSSNLMCRIVQYDSCRGLEGWTVFLDQFDVFYENKYRGSLRGDDQRGAEMTLLPEDAARLSAAKWSLIPLTRAVNSLVITLHARESRLSDAIIKAALRYPEFVDVVL